ncbi:hypothetical protein [Acidithiobacillus thiooxidans]|uniref:Toprim domain-containing protein n=1 Tax=Acidithiobacillus thiooxidans ATCC 19377 TaxID=637390 RepID=A0A543Q3K9_ACITH|nr:hypothetical protein [Acidithiobacillus thiooxidans]MDX5934974.1 hypothetical protein [Acidithiobacillus thiooxidans]TQN50901.1 hypothetical protein DLNHIDIE_00762 [Acidithiobacillus thiooxidans ATCC 19377]
MSTLQSKTTRFFTASEIIDTLVTAGIPFKKYGMEIEADTKGNGHYSCKISIKKGGLWFSSDGGRGTFSQLLRLLKIAPAVSTAPAAPKARNTEALAKLQEESNKDAHDIWSNAWAIKSLTDFYDGPDLEGMTARQKGARRRAMEVARDASVLYLQSSKLSEKWLTETGIYRIAVCEKLGENRKQYDAGARGILVSPMGHPLNPSGVQRLYLTTDGVKVGRKMRGQKAMTVIPPLPGALPMLAEDGVKVHGEGLETVLAVMQASGLKGRVYWDAGTMKSVFLHNAKLTENATLEQKNALDTQFLLVDMDRSGTGQNVCADSIRAMKNAGITPEKMIYALPPSTVSGGGKSTDWRDVYLDLGEDGCKRALLDCMNNQKPLPGLDVSVSVRPVIFSKKLKQGKMPPSVTESKGSLEKANKIVQTGILSHVNSNSKKNSALAVDCGVGKSHLAAKMTNSSTYPTVTVTPTRELAQDAAFMVAPARSPDKFTTGYCNAYPEIEPFSEKWRSIVVHKCRTCPHGLAAMDHIYSQNDDNYQDNRAPGVDMCQYILATDAMRHSPQIAATAQKLETDPTLTKCGDERRRIILDDTCNLNEHKMILPHLISEWGQLTRFALKYDQKAILDNSKFIARERAERKLLPLLDKLAAFVAGYSGDQVQIDPRKWRTFYQRVHDISIKYQDGTTAEAVRMDQEGKMVIPLRALKSVAIAIQRGTAWVAAGKLFIATPTQALEHIKKGGVLVADATLSMAVRAIIPNAITARVNTPNLKIIQVLSGQHSKNSVSEKDNGLSRSLQAKRLMLRVREILESGVAPDKICILSHQRLIQYLLEDGEPQGLGIPAGNLGWFGNHNRGHNNWKECTYLIQWGVARLGGTNAERRYMADRQAVIEVGWRAWNTWSGDWCKRSKQVPGTSMWASGEGYAEPDVDAWDQSWVTGETVQAIGRLRAVRRLDKALVVEIHSDFQFSADHGFQVNEVRERTWTQTKNDVRIDRLAEIYSSLADERGVPVGQRDFNKVLAEMGEQTVNWAVMMKLARLTTGAYKYCIDECSQTGNFHPDDSINFMQKKEENMLQPEDWQRIMENVPNWEPGDPEEYNFEDDEGLDFGLDWYLAVAAGGGA